MFSGLNPGEITAFSMTLFLTYERGWWFLVSRVFKLQSSCDASRVCGYSLIACDTWETLCTTWNHLLSWDPHPPLWKTLLCYNKVLCGQTEAPLGKNPQLCETYYAFSKYSKGMLDLNLHSLCQNLLFIIKKIFNSGLLNAHCKNLWFYVAWGI